MKWGYWAGTLAFAILFAGVSFVVGVTMPYNPATAGRRVDVWVLASDLIKVGGGLAAAVLGFMLREWGQKDRDRDAQHQMAKEYSSDKGSRLWHCMAGWGLRGVELAGKDLMEAELQGADLRKADLSGAVLSGANLTRADLRDALMMGAQLGGLHMGAATSLRYGDLRGADLTEAMLDRADCFRARLKGAVLAKGKLRSGVDLRSADLRGADLRGAVLAEAKLQDADLRGAKLFDTDLRGANLRGAKVRRGLLDEARSQGYLDGATLPDGTVVKGASGARSG